MANSRYDMLIIAPEEFVESLIPLEAHKNNTGIVTKLLSLEEIYRTNLGRDEAEKVKQCLASYRRNYGIRYAMLVGDCEKFPVRYTKTDRETAEAHDTAFYPADLYYADLFKSNDTFDDWDRNRNSYFGELRGESTVGSLNVDDVDLRPDIAVGRVPASTPNEVSIYVSKVIRYECKAHRASWSKNALLIATTDGFRDFCKTQNQIATHYLKNFSVSKLYWPGNPCETTPNPSPANINARLNQGVGFVSYAGHGSRNGWSGCYSVNDLSGLTNSDKLPVIFAAACGTAEFATLPPYDAYTDIHGTNHRGTHHGEVFHTTPPQPACIQTVNNTESLGENMTVKRATGAIGYVGCVTGSQQWAIDLYKFFFEALKVGHRTLGGMWNYMVRRYYETHVPPLIVDPPDWRKVAEFHQPWKFFLFGDPSLRILQEDCISFDYQRAEAREIDGRWKIVVGSILLMDFGGSEAEARKALRIIQHYRMNEQCFVGRPDSSMEYYLVDGEAPAGSFAGEDCVNFNPAAIEVKNIDGRWKIVEGDIWFLDFDDKEDEARTSFEIIKKYRFNHMCFVGRPDAAMIYFPIMMEREFVIANCAEGLGLFDQECKDKKGIGYPVIDKQMLYEGNPTCKAIDMCGIQAHAGYYMIGFGDPEFEFDIDEYPILYLTMKAEKDTDTCLLLLVHDKEPRDYMRRFVAMGKTREGYRSCVSVGLGGKDCFTIEEDNKWHDYIYDLRKLRGKYPDAKTVRMVQFYSGKLCNGISRTVHFFHFSSLILKSRK